MNKNLKSQILNLMNLYEMNIYEELKELLLKKTSFIIEFQEAEDYPEIYVFQSPVDENAFAIITARGNKMKITIEDFIDWKSIYELLQFGKYLVDQKETEYEYNIVIVDFQNTHMEKDFIYEYRFSSHPWYVKSGYLPHYTRWGNTKIKTFYQLPFLKPDEFLDLPYGKELICPRRISYKRNLSYPMLISQKDPTILSLRILPSTCFYQNSKRPITSMNLLRQDKFQCLDLSKIDPTIYKSGAPFQIENHYYIPVIRYALGMRNGCYFDPNENVKWLGTFYYWEKESDCYLKMGKKDRFAYFETKLDCAFYLIESKKLSSEYIDTLHTMIKKVLQELKKNFYKYFEEEAMVFENKIVEHNKDGDENENFETLIENDFIRLFRGKEPKYLPIDLNYKSLIHYTYMNDVFYASEDILDQAIAKGLQILNLDVAILGRMAGNYRIVSEILDVREREESLSQLCWSIV